MVQNESDTLLEMLLVLHHFLSFCAYDTVMVWYGMHLLQY